MGLQSCPCCGKICAKQKNAENKEKPLPLAKIAVKREKIKKIERIFLPGYGMMDTWKNSQLWRFFGKKAKSFIVNGGRFYEEMDCMDDGGKHGGRQYGCHGVWLDFCGH